ncbi:peptidase S8/S53 domain-containing protein [Mycena leptocephala]|nr:peptidase S8/S53 domain-containing protein [Mycena leptocephala]
MQFTLKHSFVALAAVLASLAVTASPVGPHTNSTLVDGHLSKLATQTRLKTAWELARISQTGKLTTMGTDTTGPKGAPARAATLDWKFPFDDTWGTGVVVYVVDSGVRSTHMELAGRVETGWVLNGLGGVATDDLCNHGTAVASLIAGTTLGIANKATIVPVRIADAVTGRCKRVPSTSDDVTAGINWAVSDYKTRANARAGIINVSWQLYHTDASKAAITAAMTNKMHVIVSAGNDDQNQCFGETAPLADQRVQDVGQIIVGNTDWNDNRRSVTPGMVGSNYGDCLTLFAPGTSITAASNVDDATVTLMTGTSFSAPLVAGVIAALVTTPPPSLASPITPDSMKAFIKQSSVSPPGITGLNGSPDRLLQSPLISMTSQ